MAEDWEKYAVDTPKSDEWEQYAIPSPSARPNIGDLAFDTYARAGMGAYDAMKWIPGVKQLANITPGTSADQLSQNLKGNANLGQQVVQGTGQALASLPQMLPFVKAAGAIPVIGNMAGGSVAPIAGLAGYGATKAIAQGQPVVQGALEGAGQGVAYSAGGALGSKIGQMAFNPLARAIGGQVGKSMASMAPAVGTAIGSAGAGAITAPQGEQTSNAIVAGALGTLNPIGKESYDDVLDKASKGHRNILNPGKEDINNIEIKNKKDIDDSMRLAAEQGLIYGKTLDGSKIDTTIARAQNLASIAPYEQQLNQVLASDPHKLFDIREIGETTKEQLNDPTHPSYLKNGEDYQNAVMTIDKAIQGEVNRPGGSPFVNAQKLNTIKQGLWQRTYTPDAPNANNIVRQVGYNAKNAIEQAFPNQDVADLNRAIGERMTLNRILEKAHGRGIQSGKIGKYVSGMVGAMTGQAVGKTIPGVGELVGPVAGYEAGSKISGILNDPSNISRSIASKVKLSQLANGIDPNPKFTPVPQVNAPPQPQSANLGQFNPIRINNPQGTIFGPNGQPLNPLANTVTPQKNPLNNTVKALGVAGALGASAMFNPLNAQASQVKEPERLQLPADQYTKKEESFQAHPYIDTKGNKTIGYGFNMAQIENKLPRLVVEGKRPLTRDEADNIYTNLYANARNSAQNFVGDKWHSLNGQQQKALTDMTYNMGSIGGFKKLKNAIEEGNYTTASNEIMNSKYAKEAPNRAARNAALISMR